MTRYYRGENVQELIATFEVDCSPNVLWRRFPPKPVGSRCRVCGAALFQPRRSRTREALSNEAGIRCEHCGHQEGPGCRCPVCEETRVKAAKVARIQEREQIEELCFHAWSYIRSERAAGELSLKAAVSLVALARTGGWDQDENLFPWGTSGAPFAPNVVDYRRHLVHSLIGEGLIAPSPTSIPEAFSGLGTVRRAWHPELVGWEVLHPSPSRFIREIIDTAESRHWPEGWILGASNLWRTLAAAECWEFCELSMQKRGLPMPGEVALRELIDALLRHFSVSHCCRIIWSGSAKATDAMAQRNLNRKHAANYMIGACQRMADRARVEGWDLKGFSRHNGLPRSEMSYVLHDVFFQHGEDGFFRCPTEPPIHPGSTASLTPASETDDRP